MRSAWRARVMRVAAVALIVAMLWVPGVADAKSATQLKRELQQLQAETRSAGKAFDRAYWKLDEAAVRVGKVDKKIKKTRKQLKKARAALGAHAAASYRGHELSMIDVLVSAASFEQLVTRMDYVQRVGESDAAVVRRTKALSAKLKVQRAELAAEQRVARKNVKALRKQRDKLQARLRSKEAAFRRVKRQLDAARGGSAGGGSISRPGPNGMVFPVVGSYYYSNTWGASRGGGRRRHKGTDIMARRGTPVVAIVSGTVRASNNGLGGKCLYVTGKGWQFYYAHLDSYKVTHGRVKAGQVIGTVGSTGNARGGSPHLHFQMHPGGGSPVNPYPYLKGME